MEDIVIVNLNEKLYNETERHYNAHYNNTKQYYSNQHYQADNKDSKQNVIERETERKHFAQSLNCYILTKKTKLSHPNFIVRTHYTTIFEQLEDTTRYYIPSYRYALTNIRESWLNLSLFRQNIE